MTYLLIILGAIIGWRIALWRGHKPWVGVVVGGLLPFGLILLALIPGKKKTEEATQE